MLAEAAGFKGAEEAFIAGLLHDIGLVFLLHHFPGDYEQVVHNIGDYPGLIEAERDILGIDHAAIGQMLSEKWNFPQNLCDTIGQHHQVEERVEALEIYHFVQLSELINKPVIDNRPQNLEHRLSTINQLAEQLNIDRKTIDEISFSLLAETITTAEYLGIDIGDTAEVVTRANKELFNSYMTIENLFRERQELSQRILAEERRAAFMETKNIAIATLSHYINNAAMAISGRGQLIRMLVNKGSITDDDKRLEPVVNVIDKSVKKILAVLQELRELTSLDDIEKYSDSNAINIDDRIKDRLRKMEEFGIDEITEPTPEKR
jgi:signal transduction histidine kinase